MGQCLCHHRKRSRDDRVTAGQVSDLVGKSDDRENDKDQMEQDSSAELPSMEAITDDEDYESEVCSLYTQQNYTQELVDNVVGETLEAFRTDIDLDFQMPPAYAKLNAIAEMENGWLKMLRSFVTVIPDEDPLGPIVMNLLLDDCPLPTMETIVASLDILKSLPREANDSEDNYVSQHRNFLIVMGSLAEHLAGPRSEALLTEDLLEYLFRNLDAKTQPPIVLHSIITLEKFALSKKNKSKIRNRFSVISKGGEANNPLLELERVARNEDDLLHKQVKFCAQWSLDNLFPVDGRKFTYETQDMSNINVMLNANDASECLKLSSNGLVARCDSSSFDSVRSTAQADSGCWYYEALIVTGGVMQIGWATQRSSFFSQISQEGFGIGDDAFSQAFDGCRQLMWYNACSKSTSSLQRWTSGDIVGCFLDIDKEQVMFSLNGVYLAPYNEIFRNSKKGFFPAASFMSFQECEFNFGWKPYKYPPAQPFKSFNEEFSMTESEKTILPRPVKMAQFTSLMVPEDACFVCVDSVANSEILPCKHRGFCYKCAEQMYRCPFCRGSIRSIIQHSSCHTQTD